MHSLGIEAHSTVVVDSGVPHDVEIEVVRNVAREPDIALMEGFHMPTSDLRGQPLTAIIVRLAVETPDFGENLVTTHFAGPPDRAVISTRFDEAKRFQVG